jgi:hypothetical protein
MEMSDPGSPSPATQWVWADRAFAQLPGIDPDLEWALGSGRPTFFGQGRQQRWIPVLVELQGISVDEFAAGTGFLDDGPSRTMWQTSVRVLHLYDDEEPGRSETTFCTAMVSQGFFEFLKLSESIRKFVIGITLSLPLDNNSLAPGFKGTNSGQSSR